MNKTLFILLNLALATNSDACSCRYDWSNDYFSFFKNATNLFVGEVISTSENSDFKIYEFKVIDKLRSNFKSVELVYSKKNMCPLFARKGQILLLQVFYEKGKLHAGYCSFHELSTSKTFKEDTSLVNLFGRSSFIVNSTYFKGEVKYGLRLGMWMIYSNNDTSQLVETGFYENDKRQGIWTVRSSEVFYYNGQTIKDISYFEENGLKIKRIATQNETILYYPNGSIYKKLTKHRYYSYYQSGQLKEKAYINKHGYFHKKWVTYDQSGNILESKKLKNNNEIDSYSFCCDG